MGFFSHILHEVADLPKDVSHAVSHVAKEVEDTASDIGKWLTNMAEDIATSPITGAFLGAVGTATGQTWLTALGASLTNLHKQVKQGKMSKEEALNLLADKIYSQFPAEIKQHISHDEIKGIVYTCGFNSECIRQRIQKRIDMIKEKDSFGNVIKQDSHKESTNMQKENLIKFVLPALLLSILLRGK